MQRYISTKIYGVTSQKSVILTFIYIWYRLKLWDLKFLSWCCWRFESSKIWYCVVGLVILTVLKDHRVCYVCDYSLNNTVSHPSGLFPLEWKFVRRVCWGECFSWLKEVTGRWVKLYDEEPHVLNKLGTGWAEHVMYVKYTTNVKRFLVIKPFFAFVIIQVH